MNEELPDPTATPETPPAPTIADVAAQPADRFSLKDFRAVARGDKTAADVLAPVAEAVETEALVAADTADTVTESAASAAGKALAGKRQSLQARIDALTREKHDSKREAEAAKADRESLRREFEALKAGKAPPNVEAKPEKDEQAEPQEEQFENYRDYVKAQSRWEARQELQAERERTSRDDGLRDRQRRMDDLESAVKAEHADADAVLTAAVEAVQRGERRVFSPLVNDVLERHPLGSKLAYELAKDAVTADRLSAITHPVALGLALAPILTRLGAASSGPAPPTSLVTKAPAPIKPVGTSAIASTPTRESMATAGPEMSLKRWRALSSR